MSEAEDRDPNDADSRFVWMPGDVEVIPPDDEND